MVVNRPMRQLPPDSLRELAIRAEALHGHSVDDLATALEVSVPRDRLRSKGYIGQLVECALGADPTAGERPDFPSLGVELKTIPVSADGRPAESTFCCSINMRLADRECWESSRLRRRLLRVLWVPVDSARVASLPERRFHRSRLWEPNASELSALQADWEDLMGAIGAGRSGTLTAREGVVLQVRPKAANASARTLAPSEGGVGKTLPLGFYLRASYTTNLLATGRLLCDGKKRSQY